MPMSMLMEFYYFGFVVISIVLGSFSGISCSRNMRKIGRQQLPGKGPRKNARKRRNSKLSSESVRVCRNDPLCGAPIHIVTLQSTHEVTCTHTKIYMQISKFVIFLDFQSTEGSRGL